MTLVDWDKVMDKIHTEVAAMGTQMDAIAAVAPERVADHMKLQCSTPVWKRGEAEIELYAKLLERRNAAEEADDSDGVVLTAGA